MFPSSETGMSGNFRGRIKGAKYRFPLQDGTWDFPGDAVAGMPNTELGAEMVKWRTKKVSEKLYICHNEGTYQKTFNSIQS